MSSQCPPGKCGLTSITLTRIALAAFCLGCLLKVADSTCHLPSLDSAFGVMCSSSHFPGVGFKYVLGGLRAHGAGAQAVTA